MQKTLAIFLISLHLTGNTELGQLLKLPQLVTHFFQHQQLDPQIGFFEFIAMHYAGDDGTTADDDFDNQLPCHNINHNTITVVYSPMVKEMLPLGFSFWEPREYNSELHSSTAPKHVPLLLQPPRFA